MRNKVVLCYAEGGPEGWEAFCVDYDLAVQGDSFPDAREKLSEQIDFYLEEVGRLPAADRARLLNRRMPWFERARLVFRMLRVGLTSRDDKQRACYDMPVGGASAAA